MNERMKVAARGAGLHARRHVVGYVALAVALSGTAYAGGKAGSGKVGGRDLRPIVVRQGDMVNLPPTTLNAPLKATCKRGEVALEAFNSAGGPGFTATEQKRALLGKKGRLKGFEFFVTNKSEEPAVFTPLVACLRR